MSACRSCGAEIAWYVTVNHKRIPLDAEPSPDGNLIVEDSMEPHMAMFTSAGPGEDLGTPRYTSHFATCPNAAQHRRPR